MTREDQRYAAINRQIKQLLDAAANDRSPGGMVGLASIWLAAEIYDRNEATHKRALAEQAQEKSEEASQ